MQRIIVDLPDPDGPQMTSFSPRETVRFTLRSTWNSPYHLFTPIISTAVAVLSEARFSAAGRISVILVSAIAMIIPLNFLGRRPVAVAICKPGQWRVDFASRRSSDKLMCDM
ncbi:hypothetical protein [Mesorhizobium sp. ORS 3428]|uniref:hypothetical protein n=1 Tax=Mesorhizobium sp. ORS 3428 TaxID=540997 RepID=UPI001FCD7C9C|nr:hypothetical protein [Mesorhizobium sp. ORS 3428]